MSVLLYKIIWGYRGCNLSGAAARTGKEMEKRRKKILEKVT